MARNLARSAFRNRSASEVLSRLREYAERRGVDLTAVKPTTPDDARMLTLETAGEWTVACWPADFYRHDIPVCIELSKTMSALVSTLHVYQEKYWTHVLIDSGKVVDLFCSVPDYFAETPDVMQRMREKWAGNSQHAAALLGVDPQVISRYWVRAQSATGKAFADDSFELCSWRVFEDFQRRAGIYNSTDSSGLAERWTIEGYTRRFPIDASFEV